MAGFALGVEDELGVMTQVATPRGLKLRSVTVCSVRPSLCEAGCDCSGTAHRAGPARVGVFGVGLGLGVGCGAPCPLLCGASGPRWSGTGKSSRAASPGLRMV